SSLAYQIKTHAKLKLRHQIAELSSGITEDNKQQHLEQITKLAAILASPVLLEKEKNTFTQTIDFLNELQHQPDYLETASPALNEFIDGFQKGCLYVLAGRPAMGKTSVALNFAWGVSHKAKVAFYSLEMTQKEILRRLMSIETQTPHKRIKKTADTWTTETLSSGFLPVMERSSFEVVAPLGGLTIEQIRADAIRRKQENKLDLLVIDQLDAIAYAGKLNTEYEQLSFKVRQIKQLALELEVPILLLCQINREGNEEPQLKHLKGTGQIEQTADLVFLIHSPAEAQDRTEITFRIAKNRHGETGKVFYGWKGSTLTLEEPKPFYSKPNLRQTPSEMALLLSDRKPKPNLVSVAAAEKVNWSDPF
ncbi:MAG: hypothetical protein EBR82_41545, partial [Caulobacteraceae bacterium]|nr:hypothetical protein [Caulobacteraceae bacterium]